MKMKLFKKEKHFKKKDFIFKANLYWKIAVFSALVFMILAALYGYFVFKGINQDYGVSSINTIGENTMIKKASLEKVLGYFSAKETRSAEILQVPVPVSDPSL